MAFIVEVKGHETYPTGGATPQEEYGEDTWGPAIYGNLNRTGLNSTEASTFDLEETARAVLIQLTLAQPSILNYRIRELT